MRLIAKAEVLATFRINLGDRWGSECTMEQIRKQALDCYQGQIEGLREELMRKKVELVGTPKVRVVIVDEDA
jgi:hypothetical protein